MNVPLEQRYRFDVYGNLKTQWHSGAWLQGSQIQAGVQGKETYVYDALHRLTAASRIIANNTTETVNYGYDAVGGLLKKLDYSQDFSGAYSYQAGTHKVQSVALKIGNYASYGFDANGNVTQRNEAGSVTTLQYKAIAYDDKGNAIQIKSVTVNANGAPKTVSFASADLAKAFAGRDISQLQSANSLAVRQNTTLTGQSLLKGKIDEMNDAVAGKYLHMTGKLATAAVVVAVCGAVGELPCVGGGALAYSGGGVDSVPGQMMTAGVAGKLIEGAGVAASGERVAAQESVAGVKGETFAGCTNGSCFVAGTPVMTAEGLQPIEPGSGYWRVVGELEELIDKAKEISQRTLFGIGFVRILNKI